MAAGFQLRRSRIGHAGGVANYILIGVILTNDVCRLRLVPSTVMTALFSLVLLLNAASILSRLSSERR